MLYIFVFWMFNMGTAYVWNTNECTHSTEYLHCNPASHKKRQKGNPVPGGITETIKYGLKSLRPKRDCTGKALQQQ
jgi:hypothetical protein